MQLDTDNSVNESHQGTSGSHRRPRRLHLGASRLEDFDDERRAIFITQAWAHLGDPAPDRLVRHGLQHYVRIIREYSFNGAVSQWRRKLTTWRRRNELAAEVKTGTNFFEWSYAKGDHLPFESGIVTFVYSEHFLEHLFLDEALSLLEDCHRVLAPGGVIRTVVPDADLRTYSKPEPVGYPALQVPFSAREKHKTRWSIYSLTEALRIAGFLPLPLRYCDKDGVYHARRPETLLDGYAGCLDSDVIRDTRYIRRLETSLVVDGIKQGREA